ncbi:MAG: TIGR04438 family Trp-rich protein [Limnobacter sp.]|nr:TIGR04438 family Trp-rich protein [Limnobacter sp.]
MAFVWTGLLLIVLRALAIEPVASWPWLWVLTPFACAFVWFEVVEPLFRLGREADPGLEIAEARRKRIEAMFPHFRFKRRPGRGQAASGDAAR